MIAPSSKTTRDLLCGILGLSALLTAILPWWHNHDYLRDFLDYGLVMAANARIAAGETPYVDFITPIQAGFLYLNRLAEFCGGGTYLGMTYGGLGLIVVSGLALWLMLRQRVSDLIAIPVCWAIVVLTATQHTIIWYNAVGALCIGIATWAGAVAPSIQRQTWPWHLALGLALLMGGLNKINFHLIALAGTVGLLLRAAILTRITPRQLGQGLGLVGVTGILLPLLIELFLTGASWSQWRYNIFDLASHDRIAHLTNFFSIGAYFKPMHDHYGQLAVPPIGAIIVLLGFGIVKWGWPERSQLDRFMLIVATFGCVSGSLALLGTNYEIAYISFGAAFALFVSLTIAFDFRYRFLPTTLVLLLPALLMGIAAWTSAWAGQRSQFGHSMAERSTYVELSATVPDFTYIKGLHVPPELAESYTCMASIMPQPDAQGLHPVFYSQGLEWLEQIWPAVKVAGLPLWMHHGTTYQAEQRRRFYQFLLPPSPVSLLFTSVPWDEPWLQPEETYFNLSGHPQFCGPVIRRLPLIGNFRANMDPILLVNLFNTNFDPALWRFEKPYLLEQSSEARRFFGTSDTATSLYFDGIMNRGMASAVIRRIETVTASALTAHFKIDQEVEGSWVSLWQEELSLPAGEPEIISTFPIDAQQHKLRFTVTLPPDSQHAVFAGWHAPTMLQSLTAAGIPPSFFRTPSPVVDLSSHAIDSLIKTDWRPDQTIARGPHQATEQGLKIETGSEVWFRADRGLDLLVGTASADSPDPGSAPEIHVLWYKGGRIQITDHFFLTPDTPSHEFRSWSSAHEGWFGILISPVKNPGAVTLRIDQLKPSS